LFSAITSEPVRPVAPGTGLGVRLGVGVTVPVWVGVRVCVAVGVFDGWRRTSGNHIGPRVFVAVGVAVLVVVAVAVLVAVPVAVAVAVAVSATPANVTTGWRLGNIPSTMTTPRQPTNSTILRIPAS
jgi:hypothetical protein